MMSLVLGFRPKRSLLKALKTEEIAMSAIGEHRGVEMPSNEAITVVVESGAIAEVKPDELVKVVANLLGRRCMVMAAGDRQHQDQEGQPLQQFGPEGSCGFQCPSTTAWILILRSASETSLWELSVTVMRCTLAPRLS